MPDSMKIRLPGLVTSALALVALGAVVGGLVTLRAPAAKTTLLCDGEYADTMELLPARLRDIEQSAKSEYTYLVRNFARYECPYFGPDGKLRRRHVDAVEHGTAFAYEVVGAETFLLTNEHVAAWPEVTDAGHKVEGVPEGCKRVQEKLRIVHDERDSYEGGQITLTRVAMDAALDAAILKAAQPLAAMPYKIGKSKALRQGNAVQVRGFPLGLMRAVNTGKVVNPYDVDQELGWNHVDFVIDALLSEGNSGSPVLALSCKRAELELVGVYHAGYKGHSALNVVVGIDQLREMMVKKRRIPRAAPEGGPAVGAAGRKRLREGLAGGSLPLFEFGGMHVLVGSAGEVLYYNVYGQSFPADDRRLAVLEDKPVAEGFGEITRLWVRGETGLHAWGVADLGVEERDLLVRLGEGIRQQMQWVLTYRRSLAAQSQPEERKRGRDTLRTMDRQAIAARELAGNLVDLVERLGPARETPAVASAATDAGAPTAALPPSPLPPSALLAVPRPGEP
jgi:S1-C subfamily serine protease